LHRLDRASFAWRTGSWVRRRLADRRKPVARCLGLVLPLRQDALVPCRSGKPFVDG
jgi:hypothetical protein